MRVTIEYEPSTGQMTDANGTFVGTWAGLFGFADEISADEISGDVADTLVASIIELKSAGFTAEEISGLKRSGLIG